MKDENKVYVDRWGIYTNPNIEGTYNPYHIIKFETEIKPNEYQLPNARILKAFNKKITELYGNTPKFKLQATVESFSHKKEATEKAKQLKNKNNKVKDQKQTKNKQK